MSNSVLISYNSTNEEPFASNLAGYLSKKGIRSALGPSFAEPGMQKELLTAKWLVVILTPEAVKSPHVQSLVNTAFTYISQGRMQGILALASLSDPVDLEDLPSPLWSTIRIYYTSDRDLDHQQAFEKLLRTVSTTKTPVHAVSSPATNWASSFSSAAFRPLPPLPQPVRGPHSSLNNRLFIGLALLAILVVVGSIFLISYKISANNSSNAKATAAAQTRANFVATANAIATATAQATATANAISKLMNLDPSKLYSQVTQKKPDFPDTRNSNRDKNQQLLWDNNSSCLFKNAMYHVIISGSNSKSCMANNMSFENFAYEAQMTLNNGDAGGLIFRSDSGVTSFYSFSLDSTSQYTLACQQCSSSHGDNDGSQTLQQDPLPPEIQANLGKSVLLSVIVINQNIYLYVNGKFINPINKATILGPGEIGVFATSATQSGDVAFSNIKVWKLPQLIEL